MTRTRDPRTRTWWGVEALGKELRGGLVEDLDGRNCWTLHQPGSIRISESAFLFFKAASRAVMQLEGELRAVHSCVVSLNPHITPERRKFAPEQYIQLVEESWAGQGVNGFG